MLSKNAQINRDQMEMIALDQLVLVNHLVRKIEAAIDFSFIYPFVQDMYSSERGHPSIDPVVLIKMACWNGKVQKWFKIDPWRGL